MTIEDDQLRKLVELAIGHTGVREDPELDERVRPEAGPVPEWRPLTIGIATHDDFDGAYFTIQAIRMYHPEVLDEVAFLLLDNDPDGPGAWELKTLEHKVDAMRYLPCVEVRGTAVRDLLFRAANSEWVLCMDSHVFLAPGSLRRLLDWCAAHPDSRDLLQGPIEWDELGGFVSPQMDPRWRGGMYGTWGKATRELSDDDEPFDIPLQGLGVFACRKDAWPGFNPRFSGFGGEEGYLHEKIRARGGRTLCLPFLRWMHRFQRPRGATYRNAWEDRIRNYLIGWDELGLDTDDVVTHFEDQVGVELTERVMANFERERSSPFWLFDAIYCINMDSRPKRWEEVQARAARLGIAHRVTRFAAIPTPESHHIGCALSHRSVIAQARDRGLDNVLILEDDVQFLDSAEEYLAASLADLQGREWSIFYLGGMRHHLDYEFAPRSTTLQIPTAITCTHAVAFHARTFDRILAEVPDTVEGIKVWQKRWAAWDQYLPRSQYPDVYVTAPSVATQESVRGWEAPEFRDRYVK